MGQLIYINDSNSHLFCAGGHGAIGKQFGWMGRKPGPRPFRVVSESITVIPREQWKDRIRALQGGSLGDLLLKTGVPCKSQGRLNYCWAYGVVGASEAVWVRQGNVFSERSPESVGGPVTGWVNRGGYAEDACQQLLKGGCCGVDYMNAPNSLNHRLWKSGWETDALLHRIDAEYWDVQTYEELITLNLCVEPVGNGLDWWGHLVNFLDAVVLGKSSRLLIPLDDKTYTLKSGANYETYLLRKPDTPLLDVVDEVSQSEWEDGDVASKFRNSWAADWGDNGFGTLSESKSGPDGAVCPRVVTPIDV